MPIFYYTAKTQSGETKTGTLEAKDEGSLAHALRQGGLILISSRSLEEERKKQKIPFFIKLKGIFKRVSLVEKLIFTRHLAVMIGAGFSLHKALEVLTKQTNNQTFKKIINQLINGIKKGETFADNLAKYPKVFNNFFVSMVRVGEKGGNLEEVLKILAQYLKKDHDFRTKVRGAMVYPTVIVVAMIGIGTLMMITVVPKITAMFKELNVSLPFTTQIVITVSDFLSNYFLIGIIIFLILLISLIKLLKTKQGKYLIGWIFLRSPFFKKLTQKINCAKFARSFSSLMESGVPLVESLAITAQTVGNIFYSKSLIDITAEIKKGKNLQESLEKYNEIYPSITIQMVGVGEQTGELSDIMKRLADFYEEEVTNITENLTSVIEPILMIVIGAIVGFFAVSMIQPMYSMMQTL
ncbi:MAG: type II secretion system F family protein [Patescibacteria group bacterium]